MTISEWLNSTVEQFAKAHIPTAQLDAEVLLCHILGVDRTWLIAHGDESLARTALMHKGGTHPGGVKEYGDKLILRRLRREPIAYLLGYKEFYGRNFIVNKHVLIPRPETESLIDLAKKHLPGGHILDVGTGSGAIGLTLAKELPGCSLTLSDISTDALETAQKNAKALKVKPSGYIQSDLLDYWCESSDRFDAIVANLPYVDRAWERSPETKHEPSGALFAKDGGLDLIKRLIDQAPRLIDTHGYLLLEADPEQHQAISERAASHFKPVTQDGYGILFQKN